MNKNLLVRETRIPDHKRWSSGVRHAYFSAIIFLMTVVSAFAQESVITGQVTNSNQEPIPGVNILIKGTLSGTITDIDGRFSLKASPEDVLVISYIGYVTEEIVVGDQSTIEISITEDITSLEEIVVIGYGETKKKLITGATAQVKGDELEKRRSTSVLEAMQGMSPGVNIASTSGQPGEGFKVNIRGVGTIGNSGPLYIVDGVQTGDIKYLNSNDIESIDVLKDAASAAIYGSQAANGVILITTKQGSSTKSNVSLDMYYGFQSRENTYNLLNSEQYAMIMNEQHINSGGVPANMPFDMSNLPAYTNKGVANTNWLDEMFVENAVKQNYSLSASGGGEKSTYSLSLSYSGQEGIVGGSDLSNYNRYGLRINTDNKVNDFLKIGQHLTLSYIKSNGIKVGNQYYNTLRSAYNTSPLLPMYDNDGNYFNTASDITDQNGDTYFNKESNPFANMVYDNQNTNNEQKIIGDIYGEVQLLKNLKFRSSFGFDYFANDRRTFKPIYELSVYDFSNYTVISQEMSRSMAINFDNLLNYDIEIKQHKFNIMAGMYARQYSRSWIKGENVDAAFNDLEHAWLSNATNEDGALIKLTGANIDTKTDENGEEKLLSYFGRVQYNFKETYLFNATLRTDGSSKFAPKHRWGYFPSVSAGWVLSNENFLSSSNLIDFLKLRVSWGRNGNQNIASFNYLAPIKFTQAAYAFGDTEGVNVQGAYPSRLSNEKIKWETSEQLNIGFDANIISSNLSVAFDWYSKVTKDWLIIAPALATFGTGEPYINGGDVKNKGVELGLTYHGNAGDFYYTINASGAYNKNNVTNIPTDDGIIHGSTNSLYDNSSEFYRAETDHPIGYFWGLKTDGLFQNTQEVLDHVSSENIVIQPDAKPGDVRYIDQNNDGKISDLDKVEIGDPNPDFVFGFNFSCNYKAFDLLFVANGVAGNQIVQSYRNHADRYSNYSTDILNRWIGEGTSNTLPRVTNNNVNYQFSELFIQNGDYLRISNITLGFDVMKVKEIKGISQLRLYTSVQNLATFTKYTGMDPEIGFGLDNGSTDKFSSGIDLGYYPHPRTILFGLSATF